MTQPGFRGSGTGTDRPSYPAVWRLAGPLILSNISVAMVGMVDTAVVGHLAVPKYMGAVAVGAVIFDFLYWSMGFLRMGTTGVVAQLHGRGEYAEIRAALARAAFLVLGVAGLLLLLRVPVMGLAVRLIGGAPDVRSLSLTYCLWGIWGAPAVLGTFAVNGWLLGLHNARATLLITLVINLVNIILDLLFVFGLGMEVRGVALASVCAQYAGLACGLCLVRGELSRRPGAWPVASLLDAGKLRAFVALNRNIFIRTVCLILAFAFFTHQGARQGTVILAANAVLLNFQTLLALGLDGFANAAEALVGRAIGSGDPRAFSGAVTAATVMSAVIAAAFSLFYLTAGPGLVNLMTDIPAVRAAAYRFLPWIVLSPLVSVWCFVLDGVFIGATRGPEMRDAMLVSTFVAFLPLWYVLQPLGNHGLWLALMGFFAARGITLGVVYLRIRGQPGGFVGAGIQSASAGAGQDPGIR